MANLHPPASARASKTSTAVRPIASSPATPVRSVLQAFFSVLDMSLRIAVAPGANGCLALRSSAAQRTLIVIVLELPAAPLLSVTVSLDLNVPVFRYTCGLMPEIAPAFAILPFVALPSPQSRL